MKLNRKYKTIDNLHKFLYLNQTFQSKHIFHIKVYQSFQIRVLNPKWEHISNHKGSPVDDNCNIFTY